MKELRRQNAWINNAGIREVDGRIINVRAIEPEAQVDASYAARPTRPGQLPLKRLRRSKKIQVQFMVRELYDLAARTDILDAVNAWARDGVLEISTRPDQMAQVIVTKYASAADVRSYTDAYTVEFEACGVPYWQDKTPESLQMVNGRVSAVGEIVVGGNVDTVLEFACTPREETLTRIVVGGTTEGTPEIELTGLSLASGKTLRMYHDALGIMRIEADGVSALGNRTPESADELLLPPGASLVSFYGDATCDITITARGWYR